MKRAFVLALVLFAPSARAADLLTLGEIKVDPPTVHAAGVQVLISGDDDRDAVITVRVKKQETMAWRAAPPLFRVHPETVSITVPQQFAGSIFDLEPASTYDVELHAVDPDGLDTIKTATVTTRAIPADPKAPRNVAVKNATELRAALSTAKAGDVITLADGTYSGSFTLSASGTADDPIVVRGGAGAILDGAACSGCNILEVYGSYVHVEGLTMRNATRALRFGGTASKGIVARRLTIRDVVHGLKTNDGLDGVYICDNDIEGRLKWPWTFASDATSHWDDRGIDVAGMGQVVCHNRIVGFGDPVVNKKAGQRSFDVYGNDIGEAFDGTELDETQTSRLWGNRFVNVMAPVSIQPAHGGPVYVLRNVLFNVPDEQIKLKSLGGTQLPSGVLIYHNTFISPARALNLQTPIRQYNFAIGNNLFVGPRAVTGRVVDWTAEIVNGVFDYNGYFPDGGFWFGKVSGVNRTYASFAAAQAAGVEKNGLLLNDTTFAGGAVGPTDGTMKGSAPDFTLAASSRALDKGQKLPGINDGAKGAAPDLGAWELGCETPKYGPRPASGETIAARVDCPTAATAPGDGGPIVDDSGVPITDDAGNPIANNPTSTSDDSGCGCHTAGRRAGGSIALFAVALSLLTGRRSRTAARTFPRTR
jgi:hypothetical protein